METRSLTIGLVARQAGVHIDTLRYYERRRLLPKPPRTASGYRAFGPETVGVVRFIKRAQGLGFTLEEIRDLVALRARSATACRDVRSAAERKLGMVREKLKSLAALERALIRLVRSCEEDDPLPGCPILDSLQGEPRR